MNGLHIEINQSSIARRAYEIHLSGKNTENELSNWLMAEAELKNELMKELNKDSAPAKKNGKKAKPSQH